MKIKVCGMKQSQNINELIKLEIDFIGFIFYPKSKRYLEQNLSADIPANITRVGVFVNENKKIILEKIKKYKLDFVQLHARESPELCRQISLSGAGLIKAFSVDSDFDFKKTEKYENSCDYFLFDTKGKDYGGNGIKYDWKILENYKSKTPFLLSGGISENDVDEINNFNHEMCVGIDINSGFETKPGMKNIEKIKKFIKKLK